MDKNLLVEYIPFDVSKKQITESIKENNGKIIVYVDKNDLMKVGVGGSLRLKSFINVKIKSINKSSSATFEGYDLKNALKSKYPIIHWLSYNNFCNVKILWDDATSIKCIGESGLESEKIDNLVQIAHGVKIGNNSNPIIYAK